jgi:hypothetical protein
MGTLHVEAGCLAIVSSEAALKTVYDSATAEQVLYCRHRGAAQLAGVLTRIKIRPFGGNQRLASVRQDENQMQSSFTMSVAKYGE